MVRFGISRVNRIVAAGDLPTRALRQGRKLVSRSGGGRLPAGDVLDLVEHQLRDAILLGVRQLRRLRQGHLEKPGHRGRLAGPAGKRQNRTLWRRRSGSTYVIPNQSGAVVGVQRFGGGRSGGSVRQELRAARVIPYS